MELSLTRRTFDDKSTEGDLSVDGQFLCFTLELPVKDGLPGSAIPAGRFPVVLEPSPKFQRSDDLWVKQYADSIPHVVRIPSRSNILIHWGNTAADTEGCILVGLSRGEDFIGSSRAAFSALHSLLHAAQVKGEAIFVDVRGQNPFVSNREEVESASTGE